MPPSPRIPLLLAALVAGVVIGWGMASLRQPDAPATSGPAVSAGSTTHSRESRVEDTIPDQGTVDERTAPTGTANGTAETPAFDAAMRGVLSLSDSIDRGVRLRDLLRTLPLDQLPAAFAKAKKLSRTESWQVLMAVGSRWAELDPKGAAAFGVKSGRDGQYGNNSFLFGVMEKWSNQSRSEAVAWLSSLPPGAERNDLTSTLITTVGRNDPQGALELIQSQGGSWRNQWATDNVFTEWAGRDPQTAAAAALALSGSSRTGALNGVARAWAQDNPEAAMAWAGNIPNVTLRKNVINSMTAQWAEADPLAVIAWARETRDDGLRRNALTQALSKLAMRDPAAALAEIQALPASEERDQAVIFAAQNAARSDARSALPLLDELAPGPQRNQAMMQVCQGWGETEPQAALEYLFAHSTPMQGGYWTAQIIQGWVGNAPEKALAWAEALPAGDNRDAALAAVVRGFMDTDFARAQKMFGSLTADAQGIAAVSLAENLVQQDPAKASSWASSLPPGKAQTNALGTVAGEWGELNATAAAQWLNGLPAGAGRDRAIASFAQRVLGRDPDGAMTWALTIGDAKDRSETVSNLANYWLQTDATGARNWINASRQLTDEEKSRILDR